MRLFFLTVILFISFDALAQTENTPEAPYKKFPTIPPFDLLQTDSSTHLTKDNIAKKRKTLIMFFSPDCPHCQHQIETMIKGMDSLKEVQIIMATYQPFEDMLSFYKKYDLKRFDNIKIGRDTKFFLPPYFRMKSLPYLALYDKKGNLVTTFEGNQTVTKLVQSFDEKEHH